MRSRDARSAASGAGSVNVELPGDGVAAVGLAPQDDERAHPDVEPRQIRHDAAMRDQDQGRSARVLGDRLPDLDELTAAELLVPERALEHVPRPGLPEGQPRRVETTAARTGEHGADGDAVPS